MKDIPLALKQLPSYVDGVRPERTLAAVTAALLCVLLTSGCAAQASTDESDTIAPGEVVTAEPDDGADAADSIDENTACEIAAASPALAELGGVGAPADTQFIVALSFCQVQLTAPGVADLSLSVEIVTAADVALIAGSDPSTVPGSFVALPDLGENGHFLSAIPGVAPADEPTSGALTSARGNLGITLAWAGAAGAVPFATFEQIARELLEALP